MTSTTNTKKTASTSKTTSSNEATAWELTRALLKDLDAAIAKAREELIEAQARHASEPFRTMREQRVLEALNSMKRDALPDIMQIARASRLEL